METLAYSQLVLTYEETLDPSMSEGDRALAIQLHQQKLLKCSQSSLFVFGAILGLFGTTTQAFALLKQGDRGPQVTRVQQRLQSLDYFDEETTGFFGNVTASAVKRFQRDRGLESDGVVGPSTEAELFENSNSPFNEDSFLSNSSAQTPIAASNPFTGDREIVSNNPFTANQEESQASIAASNSAQSPTKMSRSAILRLGDRGEQVKQLQSQLKARGFSPGEIDGIYGRQTRGAVMRLQRAENLSLDGIAGKQTLSALELIDDSSQRLYSTRTKNS